jgi:tetratricopeptide (TPR) repeat protein
VGDVSVELQRDDLPLPDKASTNSHGAYCFTSLGRGRYRLHAEAKDRSKAEVGGIELDGHIARRIDLVLHADSTSQDRSDKPAFFEEPQFTVAGVTDTSNLGGHGSDTVVRTRNSMAGEVARLRPDLKDDPSSSTSKGNTNSSTTPLATFEENRHVARRLLDRGADKEARPYLEEASRLKPADLANKLDLAGALFHTGDYQGARTKLRTLLTNYDTAPVHHLLAEAEEKLNNPLEAVRNYQRAAELSPSEANLFDWGAELLLHHAPEPATQVFERGVREFPGSVRMQVALGVAFYTHGSYDEAVRHLFAASDLDPHDPRPYEFLGKMIGAESNHSAAILDKMERFARISPENARANYYLALTLMKQREDSARNSPRIEALLQKSVQLDSNFDAAYLQLGTLYAGGKQYQRSIEAYNRAVAINPDLEEAHYRLAQVYRQAGEAGKAAEETRIYSQLSKKKAQQTERERHEVQQFVYSLQSNPANRERSPR